MAQNFSELANFVWSVADLLRGDYKAADYGVNKETELIEVTPKTIRLRLKELDPHKRPKGNK